MNISQFVPKHINLDAEQEKAPKYLGTFTELYGLVKNEKVSLVTRNDGNVVGLYIDSGTNSLMLDDLASRNFHAAYGCKPVQKWAEIIITAKYKGKDIVDINEDLGTCVIGGEVVTFSEGRSSSTASNLPSEVELSVDDVEGDISDRGIAAYLRATYDHYLSGDSESKFEYHYDEDEDVISVTGIKWGRKR